MEQNQSKFEGYAVVELMGHQREAGFVSTEYFGNACMFRIDVPGLPEREHELKTTRYTDTGKLPPGTVVKCPALPARSRYIGVSSIYAMNPCTEEVVLAALEELADSRDPILVRLPEGYEEKRKAITAAVPDYDDDDMPF